MANIVKREHRGEVTAAEPVRTVTYSPPVDVVETADELRLYADLPGVRPEDLDIRFENGELTLHAKVAPRPEKGEFLLREYGVGDFYRTFTISEEIDSDKISAELTQGVLVLHLPKREAVKPKRITVKTS
ncbi:MAG: Hsp20/alpha crystallin family protein [Gemmatales bacterium]|nr:Hsp20/alpha crystallin family protein [Gemmatales bacterium]MCS7161147.1 Hsp20/alpha crystallin family protein [Gemmatales bacterium]MDW8176350.1 Hsp20/alpha crystallin family protein [Gemmatales bacterium]MDW8221706.1 Hsp20/alpha crystallin family protein [Gemmatales bacterium]